MAYGSIKGTKSVKATIAYVESADPHNNKYVKKRNLNTWTQGVLGSDEESLTERMQLMVKSNPNSRRKYDAYNYILSFSKDEFDVEVDSEVDYMQEHVRQTCEKHFGSSVPYSVHIQADGEGGKLHAHITAQNIDLDTGLSIRDYTRVYKWRKSIDSVTRERDELNKTLDIPDKNAIVIPGSYPRKKQSEQNRWRDVLMDKIDVCLNETKALTYVDFVNELRDEGVEVRQDEKGPNTMSYRYTPQDGETSRVRRVQSRRLGTDYSSEGMIRRYESRQQELIRLAEIEIERRRKEKAKRIKEEKVSDVESLDAFLRDSKDELSGEQKLLREVLRGQEQNQRQRKSSKDSYKTSDTPDIF